MKTTKKVLATIIVMAMLVSSLTACEKAVSNQSNSSSQSVSVSKPDPVTLSYLCANENYTDNFKAFVATYETATGNKLDVQLFPATEYDALIRTKAMAGVNFDLYRTDDIQMAEYQWPKDWPEDLSNRPWVSRLSETGKQLMKWTDGKITGVPIFALSVNGIIYNKTIFEKVGITTIPTTWNEFLNICEKIKTAGYIPFNIQLANGNEFGTTHFMHQLFSNVYITHKNDINDLATKIDAHQTKYSEVPEFLTALTQMYELKQKGYINADFISTTFEMSQEKIGSGEVAMYSTGDWMLPMILGKYPDVKLGLFACPFGENLGVAYTQAGPSVAVYSKAKYKEQALGFIDMFATKEVQETYLKESPGLSVFSDVDGGETMFSSDSTLLSDQGQVFPPFVIGLQSWPEMDVRKLMQVMMLGEITPEDMLKQIDEKASIIAKGKSMPGW